MCVQEMGYDFQIPHDGEIWRGFQFGELAIVQKIAKL